MSSDSPLRRLAKRLLFPLLKGSGYEWIQAATKAWDIHKGAWSEPELELVPLAARDGETTLDLGANFGLYCYHLSRAVGPSGRVIAYEPVPYTFRTLRRVVKLLQRRNVEVVNKGCSDFSGAIKMMVPVSNSGAPSAGQAYLKGRNDDRPGKEGQVRWGSVVEQEGVVVALDEEWPELPRLSLIKCDIEGAEALAFRGAAGLISRYKPTVICEIVPWFLDGFNLELERDLLRPFQELGYRTYFYESGRLVEKTAAEIVEDNYIFIHPDKMERFAGLL